MNDLVLKGGRVIDPSARHRRVTDIAFAGGKVAAIGDGLSAARRATLRARSSRRVSSICTRMSIGAAHRSVSKRSCSPVGRCHHLHRCGQRRSRQLPRLSQARDRDVTGRILPFLNVSFPASSPSRSP